MSVPEPRVLIVADHASARFGGEAILPLHWFRLLRERGCEAWMICHGRTRDELAETLGPEFERVFFVPDTWLHRALSGIGAHLPDRLNLVTLGFASHFYTQYLARRLARRLAKEHAVDVIHQPIPVSPREPSLLFGLPAPVVIGPMNGGIRLPDAFRPFEGVANRTGSWLARLSTDAMNFLVPGKRRAFALLVANERTRRTLPTGAAPLVIEMVENGVDLALWREPVRARRPHGVRFAFLGRLVRFKAADVLLEAFAALEPELGAELEILGDGTDRGLLERTARALGIEERVHFHGWLEQPEAARLLAEADALVMPSVFDCGGAVVLEAMALGLPVVATAWGGPVDYLDETSGILVEPTSRAALRDGLARGMRSLARDPELRERLGRAGRARIEAEFDWQKKIEAMLAVYRAAAASSG